MSVQSVNCPSCGATVLTQTGSDSRVQESTIFCTYCGSQFRVRNPNYRPDPVVFNNTTNNINNYTIYNDAIPVVSTRWRNRPDWEHKTTRILGYIIGWLTAPLVLGSWIAVAAIQDEKGFPVIIPIVFTFLMLLCFFLASRSSKELERRKKAGISISSY